MADTSGAQALGTLVRMEEAAREAYDAALAKLGGNKVAPSLQRFRENHRQHADALRQMERGIGGADATTATRSTATTLYTDTLIDAVRQARDYYGVFSSLRVGEAAARIEYERALQSDLPEDVRRTVNQFARDQEEHSNLLEIATHGLAQV